MEIAQPGRHRSEDNVLAVLRAELARLRSGVDRVESGLARLGTTPPAASAARVRPARYYEVLVDVYEWGRHGVGAPTFTELGRRRGYDARGLGGFFVGGKAALRREQDRVRLSPEGHRLLGEYLHGTGG